MRSWVRVGVDACACACTCVCLCVEREKNKVPNRYTRGGGGTRRNGQFSFNNALDTFYFQLYDLILHTTKYNSYIERENRLQTTTWTTPPSFPPTPHPTPKQPLMTFQRNRLKQLYFDHKYLSSGVSRTRQVTWLGRAL